MSSAAMCASKPGSLTCQHPELTGSITAAGTRGTVAGAAAQLWSEKNGWQGGVWNC